jgi:hypothetical protein|tara:strand:+ start:410 stop:1654 length:1245 start_codon:yes stop_codon:yes gene_type:complete
MPYLRRPKKIRTKKPVTGDQSVQPLPVVPSTITALPVDLQIEQLEKEYDDDVKLNLLEAGEDKLDELEETVKENLKDMAIILDPEKNRMLIIAASQLKQEPTVVIDFEIIDRAIDIAMDSYIHLNGFDPVSAIMGFYGADDKNMPLAPIPRVAMDCIQMQNLENIPDPGDSDFELDNIDEVNIETQEVQMIDILRKLYLIFKYFPGESIKSFLQKLMPKKKWYTKLIRKCISKAISWVECELINPAYFILFGEAKTCAKKVKSPEEQEVAGEDYMYADGSLDGTGMDCIEASATIMLWTMKNTAASIDEAKDLKSLLHVKEQRSNHEANKFATLNHAINNKDRAKSRINKLNESTKNIPRYKKRFFNAQDKTGNFPLSNGGLKLDIPVPDGPMATDPTSSDIFFDSGDSNSGNY